MNSAIPILLAFTAIIAIEAAPGAARADGEFERVLNVSGPVDLDAVTGSGGIVVTRGSAKTVRVHGIMRAGSDWFGPSDAEARIHEIERNPPIEQHGNQLVIGSPGTTHLLDGISLRLEIEVPEDTHLRARSGSGGIRVSDVSGPVDCRAGSGGVDVRDVTADVHAATGSGGVHVLDVGGAIDAATGSGGIELSQTRAASIRAQTGSGGVRATLAPGAGYNLHVHTGSGRISAPDAAVSGGPSRHHWDGKLNGGGPDVNIRSGSGSVHIG